MKPILAKGTRDFLPQEVRKRDYIFNTIREVFVKYGYAPIETPAIEDLRTLTGKYGEEGDQLLFKILNNGDFLAKADEVALKAKDSEALVSSISKRGLRYDLTIPFARYVVMHQNELSFPFKRYQIQPVWRADRPQKGRYQEFYQCDVDVVGSDSLMYEAELVQIYDEVFDMLGVDVDIKINNRKILQGMAEVAGIADKFMELTIAIDKLDKVGMEGVRKELEKAGIAESAITQVEEMLIINKLDEIEKLLSTSTVGLTGVQELKEVYTYLRDSNIKNKLVFDLTLARGLNYYTGCIFEVAASVNSYPKLKMGSIGGGGRYADLTSVFGRKDLSGVGCSFGAERIYDVMEELDLFKQVEAERVQALIVTFDKEAHFHGFNLATRLRNEGIRVDIYPEPTKMRKQMKYADDRNIPYAIIIGDDELESGQYTFKDMISGNQEKVDATTLKARLLSKN